MLRQGVKTISTEFIRTRALSQLSFVQFRTYATSFQGLLLSLTVMSKNKKTLETSLDLYAFVQVLLWRKGPTSCFECRLFGKSAASFYSKKNMAEKDVCRAHTFRYLDCNFSFCMDCLHRWWLLKVKKKE